MIVETKYKCEICGAEYESENECLKCEIRHKKILDIKKCHYGSMERYPKMIYLIMNDGTECGYKLNSIVE